MKKNKQQQWENDLKALAKKHNMEISWYCMYCCRQKESLGWPNRGDSFFITLTEIDAKQAR